ncbi:MAG TPA: siderophore-interacting protein [Thermomicrobiales bacterium]|nr:siderophore-interacting protein [Thermomicrobiales bacterium]
MLHEAYGFGADWAADAEPGMIVGMWEPRVGYTPDASIAWQLLVGDETAVPAIGAILEALPAGARATVIIEVADRLDEIELPTCGDVDLRWLHRQPGTHGAPDLLMNAVREQAFRGPGLRLGGRNRLHHPAEP